MFNINLYNITYHDNDLSNYSFLITGGAGFIGSNLVEYLLKYNARHVRVLDNLSTGNFNNIKDFLALPNFEFINGDIRDIEVCYKAVNGMDYVSHQAALGSVPRSIADPISTNKVNVEGFLNILIACKDSKAIKRLIFASSSSIYGDSQKSPKTLGQEGKVMSPYAVTKLINEQYARVFNGLFDLHTIGLRYFNVFGPKQMHDNPYAAVLPKFCMSFVNNTPIKIFGDGETSRDFTFIENVVQANIKSFFSEKINGGTIVNVGAGKSTTLNSVCEILQAITKTKVKIEYHFERAGDVKHSLADISKTIEEIQYNNIVDFGDGIKLTYEYYKNFYLNE
jgi:UDP-N-acetylglucosamine 4-epimerase